MLSQFDYYDLLGIVIPGVLLGYWVPICFPVVMSVVGVASFPDAINIIAFAAFAVFLGQLLQAVASATEPLLYWSWGGRPSERALRHGLGRYFSPAAASRVKQKLQAVVGENATDQDLFEAAMVRARAASLPGGRIQLFNSLYAYHRVLLTVLFIGVGLLMASRLWGAAEAWSDQLFASLLAVLLIVTAIVWHRAKQRAFYFVREVLLLSESQLGPQEASGERR